MNTINAFPKEIFTLITGYADINIVLKCTLVDKKWALLIFDNNHLWQQLILRDFHITPGKYLSLEMSREEYKFLFLHMKKVIAEGGIFEGTFSTSRKNKYHIFPGLHVDREQRIFLFGSNEILKTPSFSDEPLPLPGRFLCAKNDQTFVLTSESNNSYQLLDSKLSPIITITAKERLQTFEMLKDGLLTGGESGNIELWSSDGKSRLIAKTEGTVLNLFSILLDEKPVILAWHCTPSFPTINFYGLGGEKLEQKNLGTLKNKHIDAVKRLNTDQFSVILREDNLTAVYIVSPQHNPISLFVYPYYKSIDMSACEGKIYILEDDQPANGYEKSIKIWNTFGHQLGKMIHIADKIDVCNGKIYLRNASKREVMIYSLDFLPKTTDYQQSSK